MFEMRLRVETVSWIHVARDRGHDVWTLVSATCALSSGVNFYLRIHCLYAFARFLRPCNAAFKIFAKAIRMHMYMCAFLKLKNHYYMPKECVADRGTCR